MPGGPGRPPGEDIWHFEETLSPSATVTTSVRGKSGYDVDGVADVELLMLVLMMSG